MRRVVMIVVVFLGLMGLASFADAAGKGPKVKLAAPTNVTCGVVAGEVVVSWDVVPGANAYQVEFFQALADGTFTEESDFVLAPPAVISLEDVSAMTVHVRALPPPKHEGGPIQGSGPKGAFSDPCVVALP